MSETAPNVCKAAHCEVEIPAGKVFCPVHWAMVPADLKVSIAELRPAMKRTDLTMRDVLAYAAVVLHACCAVQLAELERDS